MATTEAVKEQVLDHVPRRIKELNFGISAKQDIVKQGVIEVCHRELYDLARNRAPTEHGPLDARLGLSDKSGHCRTCGEPLQVCMGHYGYVKLVLPVLHIGYFKFIVQVLQIICKSCSAILLDEASRRKFLQELRRPNLDNLRRSQICKRIAKEARKPHACPKCATLNGRVKKNGNSPLKITHEPFSHYESSKSVKKVPPREKTLFVQSFEKMKKPGGEIERNVRRALDDLNPLRILNLFEKISAPDCELLGMNPTIGRPEMFIWKYLPVAPICIRPSVPQEGSTTEDDITTKVGDICDTNNLIRKGLERGERIGTLVEQWDFLQAQVAMLINSESPGITAQGQYVTMRGFCQRLKGKQGRFRGNLSGKRVDFSGRTVISPDPNIGVSEVAIPEHVAKTMTFPERATEYNILKMRQAVRNGQRRWPGANMIIKQRTNFKQSTRHGSHRQAEALEIGDIVERHLVDGDIVLFNRQPSLHKLSIMAHSVRVRRSRTFRLNECVCTPYNADFDGDEMNLHVPQTQEAKAEALELMGVKHNLATPRNGEPIIAAIQDFITGAYLLSNKDNFFDRKSFSQLCMSMVQGNEQIDLPPPAIVKPIRLWTGKQIFNVLLRPNMASDVRISLDAPCREYRPAPDTIHRDFDKKDSWLCIRDSQIMCGCFDKATIGAGKKDSVFFAILRDFGEDATVSVMNRLARLISRYLMGQGFSIGIGDVRPGDRLTKAKEALVETAYAECDELIVKFRDGKMKPSGAYDEEQTLEKGISDKLTRVRKEAGEKCSLELRKTNAAMTMANCGSKGTTINVSQMVTVVGQQIINQERVQEGFQDRTLPHFPRSSRQPPSKGFVRNSFYSGLSPSELFFHAMSGREGLVDTAVKTAETGYMSRRLMKSLEDVSVHYDHSIRNSSGAVVQFQYGDDGLDPTNMEGQASPVNLEHAFTHVEALTYNSAEASLTSEEVHEVCRGKLVPARIRLARKSLTDADLPYQSTAATSVDYLESQRRFLQSVQEFISGKEAELLAVEGKYYNREEGSSYDKPRKLTRSTLSAFLDTCMVKYHKSRVQPGAAVGATGAQSIGEPGTQMTLKTFHFAGIANLQITQGVPRMKEIINASKDISTPIITCQLISKDSVDAARITKGRIEQTFLRDIVLCIRENWSAGGTYLEVTLDMHTVKQLELEVDYRQVKKCILAAKKLHLEPADVRMADNVIRVDARPLPKKGDRNLKFKAKDESEVYARALQLKRLLPNIPICGFAGACRATIKTESGLNSLLVEGYGLRNCMLTDGVDGLTTTTNSITEARDVLGIEAARKTIINEISSVMGEMDIDPRHMQLLGDVMTYRGEVLGITRFGLSKMRDSVLQLASFEKTPDHLFEAAWHAKKDRIEGVSECIIMGQSISQGTGAFQVVQPLKIAPSLIGKKETVFESAWSATVNKA